MMIFRKKTDMTAAPDISTYCEIYLYYVQGRLIIGTAGGLLVISLMTIKGSHQSVIT